MVSVLGRLHLNEAEFSLVSKKKDGEPDFSIRNISIHSFLRCHCKGFKIIVWFRKVTMVSSRVYILVIPAITTSLTHHLFPLFRHMIVNQGCYNS